MSGENYTPEELAEFDRITRDMSSPNQVRRIEGRLAVRRFESEHGTEKCKAMFAVLQARDAKRNSRLGGR